MGKCAYRMCKHFSWFAMRRSQHCSGNAPSGSECSGWTGRRRLKGIQWQATDKFGSSRVQTEFRKPKTSALARLHQLAGFGEAKPLESLGRESKGRHYTGSEGSGGRAEGRGRDFWWGLGGEVELQALQQE